MVRKKFIDKKSATTYALVYRSTDGADDDDGAAAQALAEGEQQRRVLAADGADRVLVAQPRPGEAGPASPLASRPPTHDPRALYRHFFGGDHDDGGAAGGGLSDAKRRELLSLGFPDDGYDYLKHMRVVGGAGGGKQQQRQQQEDEAEEQQQDQDAAAAGPSSAAADDATVETVVGPAKFLRAPRLRAPAPDVRLVDARGVRTAQAAEADELALELRALGLGGAARSQLPARGALAAELAEVEAALAAEEEDDDEAALLAAEEEEKGAEEGAERRLDLSGGGGGKRAAAAAGRSAAAASAAARGTTLEGRGDLEDDFLAFANAPAPGEEVVAAAPRAVVGFDAPRDDEEEEQRGRGRRAPAAAAARGTDARPADAAAFADLNAQFDRLMQEEYDEDEDEEDEEKERHRGGSGRTVREELTPARLAALLNVGGAGGGGGNVGGEPLSGGDDDDDDGAYFDDEYDHAAEDDERAKQRHEKLRQARAQALAELEGCAPVIPNAARVASLDERDDAVLAATKARVAAAPRLRGDDEVDARGRVLDGAGDVGHGDEPLETLHVRRVRDKWDCESVLSLRTTASFQPSRLGDGSGPGGRRPRSLAAGGAAASGSGAAGGGTGTIRLSQRTGLPAGYGSRAQQQGGGGLLEEVDEEEDEEMMEDEDEDDEQAPRDAGERRPKGETAEERRARKAQAKAAQREAREHKRQLKAAFREEAGKQRRQRAAVGAGSGASTFVIP
jgi:protein LTV1